MVLNIRGGRVISVAAKRMTAEKFDNLGVNVEVQNIQNTADHLAIQYEYTISYQPDFAEMILIGEAWLDGTKDERKKVEDEWKKNKQLPVEAAEELLNALAHTGTAVGTLLGYAIGVRPPINQPRITLPRNAPGKGNAGKMGSQAG
ncbi:hypothetical protein HY994_01585 [Candidatus Micrarchaeota archaeon]|nr:hypothetical protein [Candidatus Micrarchaeota archaeon]